MARSVPPLNPLHVFKVAAHVGSFTRAAEILKVSPSAVSRQVTTLESFLGMRLFHRVREGNVLTEAGEEYYRAIAAAFEIITSATDRVAGTENGVPLNVRVPATFATRLVIPQLYKFRAANPGIHLRFLKGFAPVDFVREDVDISIQIGAGAWPGAESKMLLANWIQPMCSPKLLTNGKPIPKIDDLRGYGLLVSASKRRNDWRDWMKGVGRSDFPLSEMNIIEFPDTMLAYRAAADGLGIVVGQLPVLGPEFAGQSMVPLFDKPIRQGSYYAVWRVGTGPSQKARIFLSWLEREIKSALARFPGEVGQMGSSTQERLSA